MRSSNCSTCVIAVETKTMVLVINAEHIHTMHNYTLLYLLDIIPIFPVKQSLTLIYDIILHLTCDKLLDSEEIKCCN